MVASYLVAVSVEDLSTVYFSFFKLQVLSVVGATGSTTICYILPGLFYFKYSQRHGPLNSRWDFKKLAALCLAGAGTLIMSTSLTTQFVLKKSAVH
jgi:amino acid permease